MAVFVTANMQLGRPNAIKKYKRPYANVDEMNDAMIQLWNSQVSTSDIVYHLGNFAWDPKTAQDALTKMKGRIFLMPAEIDDALMVLAQKGLLPEHCSLMNRILPIDSHKCNMSYWPMLDWPNKNKGYWSIIGHPDKKYKSNPATKVINVSTDLWGHKPQNLQRVLELFSDI